MSGLISRHVVSHRNLEYTYYFKAPQGNKATLLFLHGYPSNPLADWKPQYEQFSAQGYGILLPELLGYGHSSKPDDPAQYSKSLIAHDIADLVKDARTTGIVHAESPIISISHDWGCPLNSRIVDYHSDLFAGFVFIALSYVPPGKFDLDAEIERSLKECNNPRWGYWKFFNKDDAGSTIEKHLDGFLHMCFPADPKCWETVLAQIGGMEKWTVSDTKTALPSYCTQEMFDEAKAFLAKDSMHPKTCWYKAAVRGFDDEKPLEPNQKILTKPSLFIAALQDYVCLADVGEQIMQAHAADYSVTRLDCDHWAQLAMPKETNAAIESFVQKIVG